MERKWLFIVRRAQTPPFYLLYFIVKKQLAKSTLPFSRSDMATAFRSQICEEITQKAPLNQSCAEKSLFETSHLKSIKKEISSQVKLKNTKGPSALCQTGQRWTKHDAIH